LEIETAATCFTSKVGFLTILLGSGIFYFNNYQPIWPVTGPTKPQHARLRPNKYGMCVYDFQHQKPSTLKRIGAQSPQKPLCTTFKNQFVVNNVWRGRSVMPHE
jgi:hypothetical protein